MFHGQRREFNPRDFDTVAPWFKEPNIFLSLDDDIRYFCPEENTEDLSESKSPSDMLEIRVKTVDGDENKHEAALIPEE